MSTPKEINQCRNLDILNEEYEYGEGAESQERDGAGPKSNIGGIRYHLRSIGSSTAIFGRSWRLFYF